MKNSSDEIWWTVKSFFQCYIVVYLLTFSLLWPLIIAFGIVVVMEFIEQPVDKND